MLVPVNVVGRGLPDRFKGVELALNLDAYSIRIQAAKCAGQQAAQHDGGQWLAMALGDGKVTGPIQVQAHIDLSAQLFQPGRVFGPTRRQHHGAGGTDAMGLRQPHYGL